MSERCTRGVGERPTHVVQLEVEAAGVAHRLSAGVAAPQCRCAGVTVGTHGARTLADDL